MALRGRVKQLAARLDHRFPVIRDAIRKSSQVRWLMRRAGVPTRFLRTHVGFFPLTPVNGLPKFVKFGAHPRGEKLRVLFGVTHDHPALHGMQCNVVFRDANDEVVLRLKPAYVTQSAVKAPWAVSALLPDVVYWYERSIEDLPADWHTLNVRFASSSALPDPRDLPPKFRFHCVLAHGSAAGSEWRVDLRHAGPFAMGTAKGDA